MTAQAAAAILSVRGLSKHFGALPVAQSIFSRYDSSFVSRLKIRNLPSRVRKGWPSKLLELIGAPRFRAAVHDPSAARKLT